MKDSQRKAMFAKKSDCNCSHDNLSIPHKHGERKIVPSLAHESVPINERLIPMNNMKDWVKHYQTDHDNESTDDIFSTHKGIPTTDYFDENGKKLNVHSPSWNIERHDAHRIKYFRLNKHGHDKIAFLAEPETIQARKQWKQYQESHKK